MDVRVCLFIDGEHFRHSIVDLFSPQFAREDYLPKHARWAELFDYFMNRACVGCNGRRIRAYWYVVARYEFFPPDLEGLLERPEVFSRYLAESPLYSARVPPKGGQASPEALRTVYEDLCRRRGVMEKRFRGWNRIHEAIAWKHQAVEFRRAGSICFDLLTGQFRREKAVDVKLATDLIMLRDIYDLGVIVSGDQDYVPAVEAVKDFGKHVVNVAFAKKDGRLLPTGAKVLNQVTDWSVSIGYEELKAYLGIGAPGTTRPGDLATV